MVTVYGRRYGRKCAYEVSHNFFLDLYMKLDLIKTAWKFGACIFLVFNFWFNRSRDMGQKVENVDLFLKIPKIDLLT